VRERVFLGEQRPIAIERPRIKEADPAVIGFEGTTRDTALIPQMEEIGANLLPTVKETILGASPADQSQRPSYYGGTARNTNTSNQC
jgi:hypothetical protein